MVDPVGFRFSPTDEEIVEHYLRYKNLGGNTSRVDEVMSTVDIYSFDPWELPPQARRESRDHVWYFFGCKKNEQNRGERQSRKTKSGFWKKTGVTTDVIRKRGNHEKMGEKRVFVFQSNPDWVMHEYVATTFLPPNQTTYTLCKVIFKGDARDLSSSSSAAAGEIEHIHSQFPHMNNFGGSEGLQNPRQFGDFLDAEEETRIDDAISRVIDNLSTDDLNSLLNNDEEQRNIMFMQENRSDYRPKMSLKGVFIGHSDDDSDSDLISATTSSIQTSSTCDSFGSSGSRRIDQITGLQRSPNSTTKLVSLTQVVSETQGTTLDKCEEKKNHYDHVQGTAMEESKMSQEIINNKRAGFFYRRIQRCIKKIQLCSSIPRTR